MRASFVLPSFSVSLRISRSSFSLSALGPSTRASAPVAVTSPQQAIKVLDSIDTLVLDCDGVLWRGSELMPHTIAALATFREKGKRLLFVTNNASKSRRQYVSKFSYLGIQVEASEIVAASYAAAAYLRSLDFKGKVLLVSDSGVDDELVQHGIDFTLIDPNAAPNMSIEEMATHPIDPDVRAVVVGYDGSFTYRKLVIAAAHLRSDPSVLFVGTNPDGADSLGNGRWMPGTGCLVRAVEMAAGRPPIIVGKGGPFLFPYLVKRYNLDPSRTAVVGDRLDTDIALGKECGAITVLPLTGVNSLDDVNAARPDERPDYVVRCLGSLAGIDNQP